ncbi:hypothetical protein [Sphingobacterium yanglingense]|uniref:Uncharacterized protein n=1 Tax=Sphingobacterium yanglingense TaxID=1437280 RepID=A0A4R6WN64_9SPHI|nr:hypothetical protein [Sphingobacterium yanglingense]TDQ79541.1 hypothetical protein CLV99_0984 [Sphingobacterium yanglingense]
METKSTYLNEVEKLKKLLGFGTFRPMKERVEVRVKNLDMGLDKARETIKTHGLNLEIGAVTPVLRSFELIEK